MNHEKKIHHTTFHPDGRHSIVPIEKSDKLWGSEHLIKNDNKYCVKIMTLEPGTQVSLHYHMKKEETFILISGRLTIETTDGSKGTRAYTTLSEIGEALTLKPGTPHTFYTPNGQLGPTVFIEASTQDFTDDSYRIYPSKGKNADNGRSNH